MSTPISQLPNNTTPNAENQPDGAQASPLAQSQGRARWSLGRWVSFMLLAALLFVGYKAALFGYTGWQVYQDVTALREKVAGDRSELVVAQVESDMQSIGAGVDELNKQMAFFAPVLSRLSWVPKYGPTIAQGPELLAAGNDGIRMATKGLAIIEPLLSDSLEPDDLSLETLSAALSGAQDDIAALAHDADELTSTMALIDAESLDPRAGQYLALGQPYLPLMPPLIRMAPWAEELLGMNEPRNYLVLVQNNHELRATGGFVTAVGHLVMDQGEIGDLQFSDSYKISRRNGEHPPAPEPLRRYMGIQSLLLRDANWSPDLPTTARMIKAIYAADTGVQIDGLVTIDLRAAEIMVNALAPLEIEGADEPLTGETLLEQILQFWSRPLDTGDTLDEVGLGRWWVQRKDFMPKLAEAALAKVEAGNVDYQTLIQASLAALGERSIQVWIDNPDVAEQLAALEWDGSLNPQPQADFLALIDSNLGFNKADYVMNRSLEYNVAWPEKTASSGESQPGEATATMTYAHPIAVADHRCDITPRYGDTYEDSAARCYYNYVRLYAPAGSHLVDIDGIEDGSAYEQRGEGGLQVFAGYMILLPGATKKVTFRYKLPPSLEPESYHLLIRRQAGSMPLSVEGRVNDKSFATVLSSGSFSWTLQP